MTLRYKYHLKRFAYIFSVLLMLITPSPNLLAFTGEDAFSGSDIPPFVNADAVSCTPSDGGIISEPGENLEKIYNFVRAKGLTAVQAAAVTGNIAVESAGAEKPLIVERHPTADLPDTTNDPASLPIVSGWPGGQTRQPGWGLIQWTPASKFVTIAKSVGASEPYELAAQLDVIWYHITDVTPTGRTKFINTFSKFTELEKATEVFMTDFLAPHASMNHYEERLAAARSALDRFGENEPSVAVNDNGCFTGGSSSDDKFGIVETALKYAWPEPAVRLDLKPEYQEAIAASKARGENVKGASWGPDGVDCHIFVKRVLRDSGADPTYDTYQSIPMAIDMMSTSSKYREYNPTSKEDLIPGTIVTFYMGASAGEFGRHIFIYVGDNDYLQGNHNDVAEASLPNMAPRSGFSDPMGGAYRSYHRYFEVVGNVDGPAS